MPSLWLVGASLVITTTAVAAGDPPSNVRALQDLYQRRAYHGAPPTIPHAVDPASANTPARCLACHLATAFVPPMQAFSPTTPHPELGSCTQCHVAAGNKPSFRPSRFVGRRPPQLPGGALTSSPPPIPHEAQMRHACASCHATRATAPEILCKHPERGSCEQCHVQSAGKPAFRRGGEVAP